VLAAAPATASRRRDALVGLLLGLIGAIVCARAAATLDARWFDTARASDLWFEGDLPRVAAEMTDRWGAHSRSTVHPLFSLVALGLTTPLRVAGLTRLHAVAVVVGVFAFVWTAGMFALLRIARLPRVDAAIFTALAATSAAGMFWLTVPETYAIGSATIVAALAVAGIAERTPLDERWFVGASAASLSITVTNWAAGVCAATWLLPWRRAVQVTANALAIVVLLWSVQRAVVPHADFFVGYSNEQRYFLREEAGGPGAVLRSLLVHTMVMPRIGTVEKPRRGAILTVQRAPIGSGGAMGWMATALWSVLLAMGAWSTWKASRRSRLPTVVAAVLAAEIGLHLIYGTETFLYALNVAPLVVFVAAMSARTPRLRRLARLVACALVVCNVVNNGRQWRDARGAVGARTAWQATASAR